MQAAAALELEVGQKVTVPFGRKSEPRVGTVVAVEDHGTWGRGMKPFNATEDTPLAVVRVDLGRKVGVRGFGNSLVEVA
jgi:hypothetical protein